MTYLGKCGPVYPRIPEDDGLCGNCRQRPAAWGDWLCSECRKRLDALTTDPAEPQQRTELDEETRR